MGTETNKKLLEVGDVVWRWLNGKPFVKDVVERVTNTQAILNNGVKLKRELQSPYIDNRDQVYAKSIGDGFYADHWYLETPEIIAKFNAWEKRKELRDIIEKIDWKRFPEHKVEPLLNAIKSVYESE